MGQLRDQKAQDTQALNSLLHHQRPLCLEVCCSPASLLTKHVQDIAGESAGQRASHWNGYDVYKRKGLQKLREYRNELRPRHLWISLESRPWRRPQNLNQRNAKQIEELEHKRRRSMIAIRGLMNIARDQVKDGGEVHWEWPRGCDGWALKELETMKRELNMHDAKCDGCQVGSRTPDTKELQYKPYTIRTTSSAMAEHMTLKCPRNHKHAECLGGNRTGASAYYPLPMVKRIVKVMMQEVALLTFHDLLAKHERDHSLSA